MKGMSGDSGDRLIQGMHQEKDFQVIETRVATKVLKDLCGGLREVIAEMQ